jgi:peptidyl-prolyl cis-trans isomerase D
MFETIRRHRNWLMPVLTLVVFVPFVWGGIYSFTQLSSGDTNTVAKVDGDSISQQELDTAQKDRVERILQMAGRNVNPSMFDTPQMKASTLDSLISDKAIQREAGHLHLNASEARIRELISQVPQFQVNGKFDYDTYTRLLATKGYSEATFESKVREDIGRQALEGGVVAGTIVPKAVLAHMRAIDSEHRLVRRMQFRAEDYVDKVSIPDDKIQADYDANKDLYRTPERVKVDYLVLRLDDIAARTPVSDAAMHEYYDNNKARWAGVEQRRASHILVTFGSKDASAPDKASARKLAEDILQQVRAKPADFARIAREKSKDPGSAASGGDLGWFGRSMMTKPFEDAAFALQEGQISNVVETEFGFHIIEVTGVKGNQARPFEEVRATIESEMRKQAAQKVYAEQAEQFTNFVYEQSDGLAAAAQKFNLTLQTLDDLTRQGALQHPDKASIFTPAVLEAVFASDSLQKHHNTKAIDIGNNALVSVHVDQDTPAAVRPLDEVRGAIRARLQRAEALRLAREAGEAKLKELQAQGSGSADPKAKDGFEAVHDLSRHDNAFLPAAAIGAVMALPADKLPGYVGVDQNDGSYAVVHVLGASTVDMSGEAAANQDRTWIERVTNAEQQEYVQALRDRMDAKVTKPELSMNQPAAAGKSAK